MVKKSLLIMMLLALFAPWAANAQTVVGNSWSDNFEGEICGWTLTNGTATNVWVWGTAVNNGGTHALYVSNDNGTSNAYSTNSMGVVYASKLFTFAEGKFQISFDWKANGESNYDYMRVWLVPATETLPNAGYMPNGVQLTSYSQLSNYTSTSPTNWIDLGVGKLNQKTAWQTGGTTISQLAAGNYYILFMWGNDNSSGTNPPAAVDNVSITRIACPYDVTGLALATDPAVTQTTATVTWTAGEATQWQVAYSANSSFEGATEEIVSSASYNMTGLTATTQYYVKVRAYCGGEDYGTWCNAISFYTACPEYTTIPAEGWTINFDDMTGTTSGSTNNLPLCWNYINTSTSSSYKGYPVVYNGSSDAKSTPNYLRFYSYYYYPGDEYAILPAVQNVNTLRVKFYAKTYSSASNAGTLHVGVMTDETDASTFVAVGDPIIPNTTTYQLYTVSLSSYNGTGTRIAIKMDAPTGSTSLYAYVDDITVEEIPSCVEPDDLAEIANTATSNSVTFGWTAVNNENTWKVQYKKSDATDWTTVSDPVTQNPYTLSGLDVASVYQVRVAAWCTPSNPEGISEYTEPITVQTECETITTFPWTENFESFTANTVPMCWDNSATTGTDYGSHPEYYWGVYEYGGNKMIRMYNFMAHGPLAIINSPTIVLPAEAKELTFDYTHNATSGAFSVKISDDGGTTFTELKSYTKGSGSSNSDPGTFTQATISLADYTNKSVILQFYSEANYGSGAIFVDNIRIDNPPTCIKPSGLTKDATTAHTATLHWTNGEEGQNAWQIAYSTTADFNPDEVTPVDVTTNLATIEGLAQSTTYYAYVRANCGDGDLSAWCNTKVSFSTLAGNVTPSGLAVAPATITSSQATASWNAVAGNTLHQSYDIYWAESTVTAVPEEPAAPNLISGITATSQVISGLDPETSYKVWVRDNCGTDGYSNWSSAVTFTTASACQTPDGLAASNVTNESATISWNTYGLTDFNLQYRISGEEWDANNIIPNVSTPYTLNPPLAGSTTYQVRVQAACTTDDSWSSALSFKTQCDPVSFPWSENFDDWESKSECWSFLSGAYNNGNGPATTNSSAWTLNSSYGSYITLSGKALTMNLYSTNKYWAVTPIIDITTDDALLTVDVAVSAWSSATPNFDDNDTLAFAISTNGGATFTSLRVLDGAELNTLGNSYTTIYVPVTGYNGQAIRFAIFGGSISGTSPYDNRCVIDNVAVIETPSCYPVGTLSAATNVTYNSAKLSWALVDDTQDEWTVQYATDENFTNIVDTKTATTNTNYELTGLTPEAHYWVRVKAACSTTDDWSNAVDFTTDVFCAVTGLTAANITQTTADLSWTGASDSYNIQYRTASPGMNELWFEGFEDETAFSQWTRYNYVSGTNRSTDAKRTDDYGFKFAYNGSTSGITPPQYLISPDLSAYTTNEVTVEFYYKKGSTWNETFNVGWSSTTNSTDAFTWDDHGDYSATQLWQAYTHTIPAGTKYVAIAYTADDQLSMYIDDFTIGAPIAAGTWQNATSETASKQLTGLAAGTKYDVQVQGVCDGTAGNWSESINFTTLPFTKTIEGNKWYFIASPVGTAPTNMDDLTDLYFYDEQDHFWRNKENTANAAGFDFAIGTGYLCANADPTLQTTPETVTLSFTGAPITVETYNVPVTCNATTSSEESNPLAGWNLVGNPFACNATVDRPFFTVSGKTLVAFSANTSIAPCEGVMVQAAAIDIDQNTINYENYDEEVIFTKVNSSTPVQPNQLQMTVAQQVVNRNGVSAEIIDNAIVSFDKGNLLEKFVFNADLAKLYIPQDNKEFAIISSEGQGEMPVNFRANENGSYTITVNAEGVDMAYLHLIDNKTGNDIDLLQTPSYTFNATTTDYESRFKLVFCTGSSTSSETFAFCSNGNWIISNEGNATLQVIDITGRILSSETVNGSVSKAINAAPGVYMIRLINGDNVKVQKIVVR